MSDGWLRGEDSVRWCQRRRIGDTTAVSSASERPDGLHMCCVGEYRMRSASASKHKRVMRVLLVDGTQ